MRVGAIQAAAFVLPWVAEKGMDRMWKVLLYRLAQGAVRLAAPLMPWHEPDLLTGEGCVERLPERLQADGGQKPLLVTGPTLRRLGAAEGLLAALAAQGMPCAVFSNVDADPTIAKVEAAAAAYRENGCDALIALGGGSPLDCAKLCGARLAKPHQSVASLRGTLRVRRAIPPLYAAPTTAGTGSEVTVAAVVRDEHHRKFAVIDFALIPRVAVLDPALTYGMPRNVTIASGLDALCHAVEAYVSRNATAKTRRASVEAVTLIFANLERAAANGQDREARAAMQQAAYAAGVAFTRAYVGYAHAVAHAVGGRYGVAHGLACAIALPAVLRAYDKAADRALASLADATGLAGAAQTRAEKAGAMLAALEGLQARLGVPQGYTQLQSADIPVLAVQAAREGNRTYPTPRILLRGTLEALLRSLQTPNAA
jgi:alcohol dehydrogenase class IV